jgi:MarR family transcriptional regulator, transcriptional regulator for hemolysin
MVLDPDYLSRYHLAMAATDVTSQERTADQREPLESNLGWLLSRASHALATELTAALDELHVTPRAHCVLSAALSGDHTQSELADVVGLDKTTMVVTVDELEAAGLAKRIPSPTDRRARVIAVTEAGRRKVAEGEAVVGRIQADVLASLPAQERKPFVDALTRLVGDRLCDAVDCRHPPRRRAPRA